MIPNKLIAAMVIDGRWHASADNLDAYSFRNQIYTAIRVDTGVFNNHVPLASIGLGKR